MTRPRPTLVVVGQVLLEAGPGEPRTAEAVGIADGRVVLAGTRDEVLAAAGPGARRIEEPGRAVVPGLHDFHLHLVGMARQRRELRLDGLDAAALARAVTDAAASGPATGWLRGRGWLEAAMTAPTIEALSRALAGRPALLYSHDTHSAWASPAALAAAGITPATDDPPGGRIERAADGAPSGVLRERATDLVEAIAERLRGPELEAALAEVAAELAGWGITGAVDAGDTAAENGVGRYAALGDRASLLLGAAATLDGRLRLAIGFPGAAIAAAAELGLRTGQPLPEAATLCAGWAKVYADGALGSRTAALFEPYTCGDGDRGILRHGPDELDALIAAGRGHGIGLAVHAIGDRAAAVVLDALQRAGPRPATVPPDRIEHLQLLRPADRGRLAALDVTASVQPVHCAADRPLVEACWADRAALAYPWRSLAAAGARLAFGSDAPIETPNPWHGLFAAVHRRTPGDGAADWHPAEAIGIGPALAAHTTGPALAADRPELGHLRPGAAADLAILDVDLATLLAADERLAAVRSLLTLVAGREVHRA